MTKEDVINKLRDLGVKFHLECDNIRDDKGRCPIVVIAESVTPEKYDNYEWFEAAYAAGIDDEDSYDIVNASDSDVHEHARLRQLRNELLSLCECEP